MPQKGLRVLNKEVLRYILTMAVSLRGPIKAQRKPLPAPSAPPPICRSPAATPSLARLRPCYSRVTSLTICRRSFSRFVCMCICTRVMALVSPGLLHPWAQASAQDPKYRSYRCCLLISLFLTLFAYLVCPGAAFAPPRTQIMLVLVLMSCLLCFTAFGYLMGMGESFRESISVREWS